MGTLVRPIGIAPAAFSRSTTEASRHGYASASALGGRRAGQVDVPLDDEGDTVQRRQLTATGHRPVSRPRRLKRLLAPGQP